MHLCSHEAAAALGSALSGRFLKGFLVNGSSFVIAVLTPVKGGIERIEVLAVQMILGDAEGFTETGRLK